MANNVVQITEGSGKSIDTRTTTTNTRDRQVIVVGHPSIDNAVAEVASLDPGPTSSAYGQVVRLAGSASVQVVGSTGSIAVHILSTNGTMAVNLGKVDGTVAVYLHSTGGTLGVNIGKIEGTSAVFLQGTGGTLGVRVGQIDGSIAVHLVGTGGTLRMGDIPGSVAVYFSQAGPSVKLLDSAGVNVAAITPQANASAGNAVQVLGGQYNTNLGVNPTAGQPVFLQTDASARIIVGNIVSSIGVNIGKIDGTIQVNVGKIDDVVSVRMNSTGGTVGVNLGKQDGTLVVKIDPAGAAFINAAYTASIFTTSSSYTGNSASGATIISPSANASFKIFAFSLTTTAQSNIFAKFTNGAGTSPTEYWRVALQAPSQGISGANLAVTPPGHLWATGVSTTLSLVLDSASLVHYSVSYIKESS